MTKKNVKTNIDLIIDQLVMTYDFNINDSLEPTATDAHGRDNRWHNAGGFFQLGSRAKLSVNAYNKAKDRHDSLEKQFEDEVIANGAESIKAVRLGERLDKAVAAMDNARMFREIDLTLFETVNGMTFESPDWFDKRVDSILNPEETAPKRRDLNAEMAARRKAG